MQDNYKKTIVSTILYTLLVLIVLFAITTMLMFFVFTKDMANIFYDLGCDKVASSLYYKTYEKKGDILYCYKALNIKIKIGDNNNIVNYYEKFVEDDDYNEFMSKLIEKSESSNTGILEKSTLVNEDNYLKNHYIRALIAINEQGTAWNKTNEYFDASVVLDIKNIGVYAYNNFISESNIDKFVVEQDGVILLNRLQDYFDDLVVLFNNNKTTDNNVEKAYIIALGNRIIEVGQGINYIYNCESNDMQLESNNATMLSINEDVKDILKG